MGGCWDKKTVGKVCCPCSADARNGLSPKEYVEGKLKELMGVAMNRKGIEDLDVGASTKAINYMLKIEAASNAMSACQEKKCAASGGSLNALSLNMTGGVAESDAGMNTDESEKMDKERNTSSKSSNVQDLNELSSVLVEMEHSQKSMGRSEWGEADGWACL